MKVAHIHLVNDAIILCNVNSNAKMIDNVQTYTSGDGKTQRLSAIIGYITFRSNI